MRKKRRFRIIIMVIFVLTLIFPMKALAAPAKLTFTKEASLSSMGMTVFPDLSSDGKTLVALDANTFNYPSGSHTCGIKVSTLGKNGKWSSAYTLGNLGIKDYMPFMETRPVISGDGKTILFIGSSEGSGAFYIYESILVGGKWSSPVRIESIPTGWFNPALSVNEDGTVLTYGQGGGGFFGGATRLYVVRKTAGIWGTPENVSFKGADYSHFGAVLDKVGDTMIFTINTSTSDLYVTDYIDGKWLEPTKLTTTREDTEGLNSAAFANGSPDYVSLNAINPSISADGKTLFFYIRKDVNSVVQGRDLYFSTRSSDTGVWGVPTVISSGEPSQLASDSPVAVSADGTMLARVAYVHTKYKDGSLYLSGSKLLYQTLSRGKWSTPVTALKTASDYCESPVLSDDGKGILLTHFSYLSYIKRIK